MSAADDLLAKLTVRPATASDATTVVHFVRELARFEKEPLENVSLDEESVLRDAFGDKPRFEVLLAECDNSPIGMVLFFENYSTWTARPGIWVEELFVEDRFRGLGVGHRLIEAVTGLAKDRGCGRVELAVLNWNPAADFYRSHGFTELKEWSTYRRPVSR